MFWSWQDPSGQIRFRLRPDLSPLASRDDHIAFLENNSAEEIDRFDLYLDEYNWRGHITHNNHNIFFHDVPPGKTERQDPTIARRFKLKSGTIQFESGRTMDIVLSDIKIRRPWWEITRPTYPKTLTLFFAAVAVAFSIPTLQQTNRIPELTDAGRIAHCIGDLSGYRPEVFVSEKWVTARYGGANAFSPVVREYQEIAVYTAAPGYQAHIATGKSYPNPMWMKGFPPSYVEERAWNDDGTQEPQRTIIKHIKECTRRVLPERAAALQ